jgi:tetratricopeptide (TPR) repeat protein
VLAETLFEAGDLVPAAAQYHRTAYEYPQHPDSAEAGYAAVLAMNKIAERTQGDAQTTARLDAIESAIRFGERFSNDPRRPAVLLKAAQDTLALGNHAQAAQLAGRLVAENPNGKDDITRNAWAVIATARFALGDYLNAELASLQRLQLAPANDPDRTAHVERLAAAIYKQGEQARAEGRLKEAAEHFLRVSQIASQSSIATAADFDAAATLNEAQEWQQAIPVWEAFIKNHPKHELQPRALENLALAYEQSGDWQSAANRYETIYQTEKDPERKRALLWRSAELYDKGLEPAAAIKTYQRFVEAYPQPLEQATEARLRIADHYQRLEDATQRRTWLQRLVAAHKEPGITERTRFVAAHAALEIAGPEYDNFARLKLVQPLKTNLQKKRDQLQKAVDAYSRAADFGVADVTTAALHRIGAIYHQFSRDLLNSERPKNLDADALEEYDILLEEQAFPFEERAISVYENNVRNAYAGIYDEWVKKSFEALRELLPIQYDKTEVIDDFLQGLK